MPTRLGEEYSINWRGIPPHMLREDIPVWMKFIEKYYIQFDKIYYDVAVGGPFLSELDKKDPLKRMWQYNNSKRLDALAIVGKEAWIIEVTSTPGLRAIGQLLTYVALWQEDDPLGLIERPILVCSAMDTDLLSSAAKYGISAYIMP